MKTYASFIPAFAVLSVVLIISVPLSDLIISLFYRTASGSSADYSTKQMITGCLSEIGRAFITCILYPATVGAGSKLSHGIKYGFLYSLLIGSLYIPLGAFYFNVHHPIRFVVFDSFVLLVQGLTSGVTLYYVFKKSK